MAGKKNKGGRPRVDSIAVTVRLRPDLFVPLDAYIAASCPEGTARPDAIRIALRDYLTSQGLIAVGDD